LNDPELVILDEMRTGLDPAARHTAWDLVRAVRDAGTSVVLVTHFMEEAERLCDRVAVHERGTVVALGAPGALIAEHTGQVTVRFSAGAGDLGWLAAVAGVDQVARRWPTTPRVHAPRAPAGVLAAWLLAGAVFACLGILLSCIPTSAARSAPAWASSS